jgi:hypothetical protein
MSAQSRKAQIRTLTYLGPNVLLNGQKCFLHAAQRHSRYKVRGSAVTVVRNSPRLLELLAVGPMVLMPRRRKGDYDVCLGSKLHILLHTVAPSHRIDVLALVMPPNPYTRDLLGVFEQFGWSFLTLAFEERRSALSRQATEAFHTLRINGIPLHRHLALSDRRLAAAIGRAPSTVCSHGKNSERPAPARTRPPRGGQPSAARSRRQKSALIPIATKGQQLLLPGLEV